MFNKKDKPREYWASKTKRLSDLVPGDIVKLRPYLNNQPQNDHVYQLVFDREQRGLLCFKGPKLNRIQKWSERQDVLEVIKAQFAD